MMEEVPWHQEIDGAYPDPAIGALTGVDQLRAMLDGNAPRPPISHLTGMMLTEVGLGTATFTMPATDWLLTPQGLISLGTLAILADGPLGCAVQSVLPPRTGYATSELSLRLVRPARAGGTLVARGSLVHARRSIALSSVQIVDERGRLVADGSSLCFLMPSATPSDSQGDAHQPLQVPEPEPEPENLFERPVHGEVLAQDIWEQMSGLEILEAQIEDDLPRPPIHFLTGTRPTKASKGETEFALPCHEWLCSPLATVEGGTIAMVAEHALSSAIQTVLPAGTAFGTIDLKVNFLRPVRPDGRELSARGRIRHSGRQIAVAETEVLNDEGKAVALATGSAMILPGRPASLEA